MFVIIQRENIHPSKREMNKAVKKKQSKAVPLHSMVALGGRGDIAPTHS
jgi:hypothetical protein